MLMFKYDSIVVVFIKNSSLNTYIEIFTEEMICPRFVFQINLS